jgi:hypothetical protein
MCDWVASPYTVIDAQVLRQINFFAQSVETTSPNLRRHAQKLHGCIDTRLNVSIQLGPYEPFHLNNYILGSRAHRDSL